jgi:hypothetical protein
MFLKRTLVVAWLCVALPLAANADVVLLPEDLAYVAAQDAQFDQDLLESMCPRGSLGADIRRRFKEFVASNPEFTPALKAKPSDPERAVLADALIKRRQDAVGLLRQRASSMPPAMFCESVLKNPATAFADRVENVRERASRPIPPAAVDPDAGVPEVELSRAELNAVVGHVLVHPEVAKYLHPDAPGRLPVRVALAAPYSSAKLEVDVYGEAVRRARPSNDAAVHLTIRATQNGAKVTLAYPPEGIHGTLRMEREGRQWRITEAKIIE